MCKWDCENIVGRLIAGVYALEKPPPLQKSYLLQMATSDCMQTLKWAARTKKRWNSCKGSSRAELWWGRITKKQKKRKKKFTWLGDESNSPQSYHAPPKKHKIVVT